MFEWLGLPEAEFYANYVRLAAKHPEYFSSAHDAREHVEAVLTDPEYAIPHPGGKTLQLIEKAGDGRVVSFEVAIKANRYHVVTAYPLEPGQLERIIKGAERKGATLIPRSSLGETSRWPSAPTPEDNTEGGDVHSARRRASATSRAQITDALGKLIRQIAGPDVAIEFLDQMVCAFDNALVGAGPGRLRSGPPLHAPWCGGSATPDLRGPCCAAACQAVEAPGGSGQ